MTTLSSERIEAIKPRVIETAYRKWLVVSADGSALRFGVIGDTREDALARFAETRAAWRRLHELPDPE